MLASYLYWGVTALVYERCLCWSNVCGWELSVLKEMTVLES